MSHPNKFDGMMNEFCAKLGCCGCTKNGKQLHVTNFIPAIGPVSADQFARWLIMAEGLDPDRLTTAQRRRWMLQLQAVFVKHMGANVIDAGNLRFEDRNTGSKSSPSGEA